MPHFKPYQFDIAIKSEYMILPRKLNPCDLVNNTLPRYAEGNRRESNPEVEVTRGQVIQFVGV